MSTNGRWDRCYKCNEPIWLSPDREEVLRRSHQTFYCLWGHGQVFTEAPSEADLLRCEVFALFAQWWGLSELPPAHTFPGLWKGRIGDFEFSMNGHDTEIDSVPPYRLMVVHKDGFIPALIGPYGGVIVDGGEDELLECLRSAIADLERPSAPTHTGES